MQLGVQFGYNVLHGICIFGLGRLCLNLLFKHVTCGLKSYRTHSTPGNMPMHMPCMCLCFHSYGEVNQGQKEKHSYDWTPQGRGTARSQKDGRAGVCVAFSLEELRTHIRMGTKQRPSMAIHPGIAGKPSGFEEGFWRDSSPHFPAVSNDNDWNKNSHKKTLSGDNCPGNLSDLIVQAII